MYMCMCMFIFIGIQGQCNHTSKLPLAISNLSFAKVAMSLVSMSLSPYTRLASCSHSRTRSTGDLRHSGVANNKPYTHTQGGREGGRERGRERRREGEREGGREGGRERGKEGGRERGREGEREGGRGNCVCCLQCAFLQVI